MEPIKFRASTATGVATEVVTSRSQRVSPLEGWKVGMEGWRWGCSPCDSLFRNATPQYQNNSFPSTQLDKSRSRLRTPITETQWAITNTYQVLQSRLVMKRECGTIHVSKHDLRIILWIDCKVYIYIQARKLDLSFVSRADASRKQEFT